MSFEWTGIVTVTDYENEIDEQSSNSDCVHYISFRPLLLFKV